MTYLLDLPCYQCGLHTGENSKPSCAECGRCTECCLERACQECGSIIQDCESFMTMSRKMMQVACEAHA